MARSNRHRQSIPRPGKKLDHTRWEFSSGYLASAGAGVTAFNFSSVGTNPSTLLRMRGEVSSFASSAASPNTSIHVAYGIILVPEGSGTTVQFAPLSDANAPWLLYGVGLLSYDEKVVDVIAVQQMMAFRHTIDNKAMRIIRPDIEMQLVVENTTVQGAMQLDFSYQLRWL